MGMGMGMGKGVGLGMRYDMMRIGLDGQIEQRHVCILHTRSLDCIE
jgi:hypothetical protein